MLKMSALDENSEKDKDTFEGRVNDTYANSYHLAHFVSVGLNSTYILHIDQNFSKEFVATALSDGNVHVYTNDLVKKDSFKAHENLITGIKFNPKDPSMLYTCSLDMTVKLWDMRSTNKPAKSFFDSSSSQPGGKERPFTSLSVDCSNKCIVAGTEQVTGDACLLFWDSRSEKLLGGYWESHLDDITAVKFHPSKKNILSSGSTDGIVNVFDVRETLEDDALTSSVNTESSVQKLNWFESNDEDSLAILTHTEDVKLWKLSDHSPKLSYSREKIVHSGMKRSNVEYGYVIDILHSPDPEPKSPVLIFCGSSCPTNPCLRLCYPKKSKLKPYGNLKSTKMENSIVRCSTIDKDTGILYTGNENGILSKWKPGEGESYECSKQSLTKLHPRSKTSRKFNPY